MHRVLAMYDILKVGSAQFLSCFVLEMIDTS